ncbi:hypothetical protein [Microcystis sp. M061S2]|uniref:hypothetical protein n=1 Tax=Microcystis sp. M061S2 TaxID=2771171 RepID=UPI0025898656|nr:hypothetical protein [Microcystis sp. M061S2]MCA2653028.1 hypothetical protein [Microcystis sp. M061S2]
MRLIPAIALDRPREVSTKYGQRLVIDAMARDTGEKITLWRPSDDDYSKKFVVRDMPITVAIDAKGKFSLVENPDHLKLGKPLPVEPVRVQPVHNYDHKIEKTSESDQSLLSPDKKREIASYISEMAKLYGFCLTQAESLGAIDEDRRAIATTLFISAQKKFSL